MKVQCEAIKICKAQFFNDGLFATFIVPKQGFDKEHIFLQNIVYFGLKEIYIYIYRERERERQPDRQTQTFSNIEYEPGIERKPSEK